MGKQDKQNFSEFFKFATYDYQGLQDHLEEMALKGWKLEYASPFSLGYKKIKPRKLKYAIEFTEQDKKLSSLILGEHTPGQYYGRREEWHKVCDYGKMQIFVTADENAAPMKTDQGERLDDWWIAIARTYGQTNILIVAMMVIISVFMLAMFRFNPDTYSTGNVIAIVLMLSFAALMGILSALYMKWNKASRKVINEGGKALPQSGIQKYMYFTYFILFLELVIWIVWTLTN